MWFFLTLKVVAIGFATAACIKGRFATGLLGVAGFSTSRRRGDSA